MMKRFRTRKPSTSVVNRMPYTWRPAPPRH
jgi:hypothetical protein